MNISFIGVSGHLVKGSFQKNDTIKAACDFLSSSLNVPPQLIRIRNPNESIFLSDHSTINDSIAKNSKIADFLIYLVLPIAPTHVGNIIGQNPSIKSDDDKSKNVIPLPSSFVEIVNCMKSKPSFEAIRIYRDYNRSFRLPSDFYEKVESLHQMGFEIEESKEALRSSGFNVEAAVNRLINNQNNRHNIDEEGIRIRSSRLVDLLELISIMRNDDGHVDHDRIGRIIRRISHRSDDEHDDNDHNEQEEQNEHNENDHHHRFELRHFLIRQDSDNESEDDDSIDNPELNDMLDELSEKLEEIDMGNAFDTFSKLVEECRDLIARSKDEQIIGFINFLNDYIDQNETIPRFFERKINDLSHYFETERHPDVEFLITTLNKIIRHNYDNNGDESDSDDNQNSDDDDKEESDSELDENEISNRDIEID